MLLHRLVSRPGASFTQVVRASAAETFTPIRPVEKCPQGFYRNPNPLVEGKVLVKKVQTPSGRHLDYVIGTPKDRDLIARFSAEGFAKFNSLCAHHKMTFEEIEYMAAPVTDYLLEKGVVICAYDGDKIVGTLYTSYNYEENFEEMFHGELPGKKNPVFRVKDDYAEEIKSYPFPQSINYFMALLDIVQPQTGKFLPAGIKVFGINETATVHQDYQRDGITAMLFKLSEQTFKDRGVHHIGTYAIASGTQKLCQRQGHELIYSLQYSDFKENGKPVYYDLIDGATRCDAFVLTLK